jgi:MFS superfamily sulfate permease-like transporter
MNMPRAHVTTGKASLIGGIVVGIASLVLCLAVTRELGFDGVPGLAASLLVAAAAGIWTRLADL